MKIKSVIGFVFKLRILGAPTSRRRVAGCYNGTSRRDASAPRRWKDGGDAETHPPAGQSQPPVESNCSRSCPHNDATPTKRLIKRWAVGVKNVSRNDLPKKTFANRRAKASYFSTTYGSNSIFGRFYLVAARDVVCGGRGLSPSFRDAATTAIFGRLSGCCRRCCSRRARFIARWP